MDISEFAAAYPYGSEVKFTRVIDGKRKTIRGKVAVGHVTWFKNGRCRHSLDVVSQTDGLVYEITIRPKSGGIMTAPPDGRGE